MGTFGSMTISTLTDAHAMLIFMICMAIFCFAFLMGKGFTDVYVLIGGWQEWFQADYPVDKR